MSVIVAKRNKSPIQFVDDSRKLADIVASRMEQFLNKMEKKYSKLGIDIKSIIPAWFAYLNKFNCFNKKSLFLTLNY